MKHAILITAYKDMRRLLEFLNFFDEDFEFYIHMDRKWNVPDADCKRLEAIPNVACVSRKYKVNWGGMNHLRAILLLAGEALKNKEVGYIHSVSGSDFPIKGPGFYRDFFAGKRAEYLENFPVPAPHWYQEGVNRYEYFYFMDWLDVHHPEQVKWYYRLLGWQEKCHIRRPYSKRLPPLHGGSVWWSLTSACVAYVLEYTREHPRLFRRLRFTFIPEEFYFQTVIMNSPFAAFAVNDNLRYIDWSNRNGNSPAVLDMSDAGAIMKSGGLFARKLERPVSSELLVFLKREIFDSTSVHELDNLALLSKKE